MEEGGQLDNCELGLELDLEQRQHRRQRWLGGVDMHLQQRYAGQCRRMERLEQQ